MRRGSCTPEPRSRATADARSSPSSHLALRTGYRLGLAARVDGLLRSERFVDFDALHVALAVHRGVTIYLVSYWTDVWNSPLGARALYESARR